MSKYKNSSKPTLRVRIDNLIYNTKRYLNEHMRIITMFMAVILGARMISILYTVVYLELKAGRYGLYQIPLSYSLCFAILILCLIYLKRRDLDHLKIFTLHIFTVVWMSTDIYLYVNSISIDNPF